MKYLDVHLLLAWVCGGEVDVVDECWSGAAAGRRVVVPRDSDPM